MNNNHTIILIVVFGGLALLAFARGLYTIYKREGPLMGRGKKFIVKGRYAVWAGVGQIIIGMSFLMMALNSYSLLSCSTFFVGFLLGTFIHFAGGFRDPGFNKELQQQQEFAKARDNDPAVAEQRKQSIVKFAVISLTLGIAMTIFMFYLGREVIKELSSMEFVQFFLLSATFFSSLLFLGFLSVMIRKRSRGEW